MTDVCDNDFDRFLDVWKKWWQTYLCTIESKDRTNDDKCLDDNEKCGCKEKSKKSAETCSNTMVPIRNVLVCLYLEYSTEPLWCAGQIHTHMSALPIHSEQNYPELRRERHRDSLFIWLLHASRLSTKTHHGRGGESERKRERVKRDVAREKESERTKEKQSEKCNKC